MTRRVVITGVGTINSLAHTAPETWGRLLEGRSGVAKISLFDASEYTAQIAGEVKDFDPTSCAEKKEVRKLDRFTLFGMHAADEAWADSGLTEGAFDATRAGCMMGVGIGGLTDIEATKELVLQRGPRRISPHFIPKIMMNAVSGRISMRYGLQGGNFVTASACASANHALGLAYREIKSGYADVMVAGGSEATVTSLGIGGFCALRALSTRNDAPEEASRPFDKGRDGFVLGEGAGAVVFEEYEHAKKRGAQIYAELTGFGMSADAFHITQPAPEGRGASSSIRMAVEESGINLDELDYVNAHGTSTPINDPLESQALKTVFGAHAEKFAVSSTKSMTGHLLGAAGALEIVVCALSVRDGKVHPTINLTDPDPDCDLDYIAEGARGSGSAARTFELAGVRRGTTRRWF